MQRLLEDSVATAAEPVGLSDAKDLGDALDIRLLRSGTVYEDATVWSSLASPDEGHCEVTIAGRRWTVPLSATAEGRDYLARRADRHAPALPGR